MSPLSFDPPTLHTVHPAHVEPLYPGIKGHSDSRQISIPVRKQPPESDENFTYSTVTVRDPAGRRKTDLLSPRS